MKYLTIFAILLFTSCTKNARSRNYGGTSNIDLPTGQKLVTATWKEANLWYLTRPAKEGETPEVLTLQESSNLGIMQGKVVFKEH